MGPALNDSQCTLLTNSFTRDENISVTDQDVCSPGEAALHWGGGGQDDRSMIIVLGAHGELKSTVLLLYYLIASK